MKQFLISLILLCCVSFPTKAETGTFSLIPIVYDGRLQPMESFARSTLKLYSGKEILDNDDGFILNANEWLIETLFEPHLSVQRRIFKIENPAVLRMLGIQQTPERRFSYEELLDGLAQSFDIIYTVLKKEDRTQDEEDFLSLHHNVGLYVETLRSLSMFLPIEISKEDGLYSTYMALQASRTNHPALPSLHEGGKNSHMFRVIETEQGVYTSPWDMMLNGLGSPQTSSSFKAWQQLMVAFQTKNKKTWNEAVQTLSSNVSVHSGKFELELLYNKLSPIKLMTGLYWLSFLLLLIGFSLSRTSLLKAGQVIGLVTLVLHISVIAARIIILSRAPIGTLYESTLFVALIFAASGFWIGRKSPPLVIMASLGTGLLLLLSFYFKPVGGDFALLEAVLNTNFWLATHVICITIGYGWCIMISSLAHLELWKKKSVVSSAQLRTLTIIALIFTVVGTLLGGLWADQSWGRFWGWDPKENGALLIVLWIIWLVHGKLSGHISPRMHLAGLAYLSVIVALSWFGVNLLSVGLHAYGFVDGVAFGLLAFCIVETTIITALVYHRKKERPA
ncbi:MAG: cytochrome c biogenesis protein CcsA [Alphaproteobacteria bacterium]|nr:cytochrome c biogenesis protein CcsA [Alphaproteobacteria bacterium]